MKVLFICYANYCRSPVAEKIYNYYAEDSHVALSAGLINFNKIEMDPRSQQFLKNKKLKDIGHHTRQLNYEMMESSDCIYTLDLNVLLKVQKKFPKYVNKVKIINHLDRSVNTSDPYMLKDIALYNKCLDNIHDIVINLIKNAS